ncbi:TOTE conflict system archaeo-eukaryotic primase domain-containing protein [Effusibacillus consociatus]|uniref:DEAD/DEAH box helicase family protein n=1 Tax=Effusibacillus consociatus TaxID=1117041 RepID=A0ABV9QA56_9BACL
MAKRRDESAQLKLDIYDPNEMERLRAENNRLQEQNVKLLTEIEHLKQLIHSETHLEHCSENKTSLELMHEELQYSKNPVTLGMVTKQSPIEEKIVLFRDYFKGREDVYAVRGIDKRGKPAYFPQKERLGKENGKIVWGDYLPLTDEVIKAHLQEENRPVTIGIYPLLLDETCWFLAIDFDKASWKKDTAAFLEICRNLNVPAALERSRSGNGGHVWIFFNEQVPARTARMLGSTLLTLTLEKRHQIGLDSYDRMFPNQDTLPKEKKLGNLIALPLQRLPGKEGNSLFIDDHHEPYKDQWIFLSSLRKMALSEVEAIVREAERKGDVIRIAKSATEEENEIDPWTLPLRKEKPSLPKEPLPTHLKLVLSNMLYVGKEGLSSSQINHFIRMAAFQNPEFYKAQSMRLPTFGKPRIINCSEDFARYLALPRGCYDEVVQLLQSQDVIMDVVDERNPGTPIDVAFQGELKDEQKQAVHELLKHDTGILSATTAFGKTVVGGWMIAARAVNTLILVHRTQLMEQWKERLSEFLNIPVKEIGMIGGGKNKRTGRIDVAMLQTIHAKGEIKDFIADYGHIVVDECHHISAFSFEQVFKQAKAKYILGLTATLTRKDGHHPILLTDRTSHLEYFKRRLQGFAKNVIVLRGGMGKKQLKAVQEQIRSIPGDQERVLLATGRFVGEGFDDARLDTLFLVTPISWKGTLQQYAGRLHRLYEGKHEVQIYDYVDTQVPMFMRMYKKRLKGYHSMGYSEQAMTIQV